ncbi:MAG: single-stranded DNA-binding protein [Verrucomicrobiae bacterium]|nr:single-stranded DNA-binding protein [Verrucomicrobiae bacterium]
MSSLNKVFLMGNLTRDPEVRYTPKGTAVTDISIAINTVYRTQEGDEKEEVTYVDIVTWGRQAETCGQYLTKGAPVFVEGRLQLDQWEDKDGQKKSRLRVRAERVQFLGRPRNAEFREGAAASAPASKGAAEKGAATAARSPKSAEEVHLEEDDIPF